MILSHCTCKLIVTYLSTPVQGNFLLIAVRCAHWNDKQFAVVRLRRNSVKSSMVCFGETNACMPQPIKKILKSPWGRFGYQAKTEIDNFQYFSEFFEFNMDPFSSFTDLYFERSLLPIIANCLGHVFSPSLFTKSSQKLSKKPKVDFTTFFQYDFVATRTSCFRYHIDNEDHEK